MNMPHSSGGGSHGGGSHGSSHGGSRGGGSRGPTISRGRFPGSTRYVYYRRGEPKYFYADRSFKPGIQWGRLLLILFYLPFLFVLVPAVAKNIPIAKKNYDHNIVISDEADVINDEQALYDSLERFMKKTGVTPSVVTVYNDVWSKRTLEEYAYDRYLSEFNDEMHWLIVYSQDSYPSGSYIDWHWEGMQGDDTDNILTTAAVARFTNDFHSRLQSDDRDVGAQLIASFDQLTASYKKGVNWAELGGMMCPLAFVLFHMFFMVFWGTFKYRGAKPAPEVDTFGLPTTGNDPYNGTDTGYGSTSPYSQTGTRPDATGNNTYGGSQYEMPDLISGTENSGSYSSSQSKEVMCEFCGSKYSARLKRCPHCNANNPDNPL
jgi:hypothetical protein